MHRHILSLLLSILVVLILMELSSCKNNSKAASESLAENASAQDTSCDLDILTVPYAIARVDSLRYLEYIKKATLPVGYSITNPLVNYFTIPVQNVDTLVSWEKQGKILPNPGSTDSSWVMLALETDGATKRQTITTYFACYSALAGGKKGPMVYYNLQNPGKVNSLDPVLAKQNIAAMKTYIDKLQKDKPFYPYGFQFPWDDLVGIACSVKGVRPNNTIYGILVINNKDTVDYYIHSFYQRAQKRADLDEGDGEYYDFTSPCPNSCIP
ncbi:hypothetical protein [Haliscomenobacter hydrossis]|uniref:Uncharacterized protein n=1 Tax=Haliscomenobacter hydrossis (strain ATCC 27775 / DSM 1100 / LMG 10767 / O) TaxID=760192 RepID=F4KYF1_HALH1|nr:hypothetical protein [Haliscomenobacter hydrossis]AEE49392.1 hypothetical protein Halhy_1499 [Haliscomenobacter hydrossis DSM 1100]